MATTKKLLIQFGDAETPEVFTHACTINTSQDFTIEATTTDATEPNCEDPDAPGWVLRAVDTLSAGINGAGTMDPVSFGTLRDHMLSGQPFNAGAARSSERPGRRSFYRALRHDLARSGQGRQGLCLVVDRHVV